MASLFSKARTLVLGNLHTLLDAAIDLNSIGAVKQRIRDLEAARDGISAQAAVATGRSNSLKADIANKQREVNEAISNIDLLLGDDDASNDTNAVTIQLQVDGLNTQIEALSGDLTTAEEMAKNMRDALARIRQKHAEMLSTVKSLEQQEASAKASDQAAGALEQVKNLSNIDAGASIDNVQQRIRDRKATADARLNQAFGDVSSSADDSVALAKAKKAIEARKAELNANKAAA